MCGSRAKWWIIGFLLLAAIAAATAGYLMSRQPDERADKGTLVRAAEEELMDDGECLVDEIRTAGGCL